MQVNNRECYVGEKKVSVIAVSTNRRCTYNLYEEIKTGKPGRKPATANVGLNIGLSNTPIGPSNVRKIFLSTNIPAPSRRGLQKCANAVCKIIENVNKSDIKARRKSLKTINLLR